MVGSMNRREMLKTAAAGAAASVLSAGVAHAQNGLKFEVSLMESSLARSLVAGKIDHMSFARIAGKDLKIPAIEYVSRFFADKVQDDRYLEKMNKQAGEFGVRQLLVVVDSGGLIADAEAAKRTQAQQLHRLWVDAAKALGCHSIQINPTSSGEVQQQQVRAVDALSALCEYAAMQKMNVLLGDFGGVSTNAAWVAAVVKGVNHPCCGAHPQINHLSSDVDFAGLATLVPLAKGIAAVTREFDQDGRETSTDYLRALKTVQQAGYRGYIGIHYVGEGLGELEGIEATKKMLARVQTQM